MPSSSIVILIILAVTYLSISIVVRQFPESISNMQRTIGGILGTTTTPTKTPVFQTDFEDIAKQTSPSNDHSLNLSVGNWFEFAATHPPELGSGEGGARMWVEGLERKTSGFTCHSGSRCIGMEVTDINKSRRAEFVLYPESFVGKEYSVSVWLYLPSDWGLHAPGINWNWYAIANPYAHDNGAPYTEIWINQPGNPPGSQFDVELGGRYLNFTQFTLDKVTNFPLPRGRWFNLKYYVFYDATNGSVKVWLDDKLISDRTGLQTQGTTKIHTTVAKIYYERSDTTAHQIWVDDLEIYKGFLPEITTTPSTTTSSTTTTTIPTTTTSTTTSTTTTSTTTPYFLLRSADTPMNVFYSKARNYQPNGWNILKDMGINIVRLQQGSEGDPWGINMEKNANWAENLNNFLNNASAAGLKVYFYELGNNWGGMLGIRGPTTTSGWDQNPANYMSIAEAKSYIDKLAAVNGKGNGPGQNSLGYNFITDPRIWVWSVENEVDITPLSDGGTAWTQAALDWVIAVSDRIRSYGGKTVVASPRTKGGWGDGESFAVTRPLLEGHIDYLEIHHYGIYQLNQSFTSPNGTRNWNAWYTWYRDTLKQHTVDGRGNSPIENLILGEFGIWHGQGNDAGVTTYFTEEDRKNYYELTFQAIKEVGLKNVCFHVSLDDIAGGGSLNDIYGVVKTDGTYYPYIGDIIKREYNTASTTTTTTTSSSTTTTTTQPTTILQRSVRIDNYNNWFFGNFSNTPQELDAQLNILGLADRICYTELYEEKNIIPGWRNVSVQSLKTINPNAKIYRIYDFNIKNEWDTDWPSLRGYAKSGSSVTLVADFSIVEQDRWKYQYVHLVNGSGAGQVKKIKSINSTTIMLTSGQIFNPIPDKTTFYSVIQIPDPYSPPTIQTPLTYSLIDKNDWWLRSPEGNRYNEVGGHGWFLDMGKPGFKEAYLQGVLDRVRGKGFDGIVFDYPAPSIYSICKGRNSSNPNQIIWPQGYSSDSEWFDKAWKPFFEYVTKGLVDAGYHVIVNNAGETYNVNPSYIFQRSKINGTVYEQWAVDWGGNAGKWLSGKTIEQRIKSFRDDPLETWIADYGVLLKLPEYDRKANVGLAMYYIALPNNPELRTKRFYHHYKDGNVFWEPLWDFYIGEPAQPFVQLTYPNGTNRFFWARNFTNGLVLLNYEDSTENISYSLIGNYVDSKNNSYSGTVSLASHTALILQRLPATTTTTTTTSTTSTTTITPSTTTTTTKPITTTTTSTTTTTLPSCPDYANDGLSNCWSECIDDNIEPDCFSRIKHAEYYCSAGMCCESIRKICPTTTTIPKPKFNSTEFKTINTTSGRNITFSYNNSLNERANILFIIMNEQGLVVDFFNTTVTQGIGSLYKLINCTSLGTGKYTASWEAYLESDNKLLNTKAWSRPNEWKEVSCS